MDELKYEKIGEANNRAEAEIIESFLEAEGIDVELVEESISRTAYAFPLTRVEIFVPNEKAKQAHKLLKEFDDIQPKKDEENT
jgi:fibronectin type 3 domain-containing protein